MKNNKLPENVLVYKCDTDDVGDPIYCVTGKIEDIPEDMSGERVGYYKLVFEKTFRVEKQLK